jgi:hypothetical protein
MHTATPGDAYLAVEMAKRRIPGLAISVAKDSEVVRSQRLGLASIELDVPVTPAIVFELASLTKQFTAAGIMRLVEEGKVRLEDEIGAYRTFLAGRFFKPLGTEYTKFPDDNLTVIVLTNLGNRGFDPVNPWGLTIDVAEFYLSGGGPIGAGEST